MTVSPCTGVAGFLVGSIAWCAGAALALAANAPFALDAPPGPPATSAPQIQLNEPVARRSAEPAEPRGNPLWAIPLSSLSATRERPLFLPSRRPPVAAAISGPPPVAAAQPIEDQRPPLALVGTVSGETEGIAVFVDLRDRSTIRMRTGEEHAGWSLDSVRSREATLTRGKETVLFVLPAPGASETPQGTPHGGASATPDALPVLGGPLVPGAANTFGAVPPPTSPMVMSKDPRDFAPFMPRSTPKNGESDGL
jgi:general secretion pathway protein N